MSVLIGNNLGKWYGAEHIFDSVTFQVAHGDKIALVGPNGAGKSTLMKIIGGLEDTSEGTLSRARGLRLTYQAQEAKFPPHSTLRIETHAAFAHISAIEAELQALESRIADTAAPDWDKQMERYGELQHRYEHAGGYEKEHRIERTLHGLGFVPGQWDQPLEQFSGGQRTRAALAIALLGDPDVLLLDEPTNHLDMAALEWLETFLKDWDGTLIVISHDRYFLDRVTTRTWEMDFGRLEDYAAPYSKYQAMKAERLERALKEFEAQQQVIAKTEEFIRRFKAGQRSKEAKGREKRLNRLKEGWNSIHGFVKAKDPPARRKEFKFALQTSLRSGEIVLALDGLQVGYRNPQSTDAKLLSFDELYVMRGERVALLGPNGSGKSTLLRTLVNQLPPLGGVWELGANVQVGYYAQGHEGLQFHNTVLDEVLRLNPLMGETKARTLLGRFLFTNDDVYKQVSDLSGGERSRVALAQLMLGGGNFLVLDEPTNHLDIQAREALETVLNEFNGTILFVSHDRYFIDAVADTLWMVEDGSMRRFDGNYSALVAEREAERRAAEQAQQARRESERQNKSKNAPANGNGNAAGKKQLAALEREIAQLEERKARLDAEIMQASSQQQSQRVGELGTEYAALEIQLGDYYDRWAELAESV